MKTTEIKFVSPRVIDLTPVHLTAKKICEYHLILDWGQMGIGAHRIYKKDGEWFWTDNQSPIPVRSFNSLSDLMWEYELPQTLKKVFENLIESK